MANDPKKSITPPTNAQDPAMPAQPATTQQQLAAQADASAQPALGPDGKPVPTVKAGDEPHAIENKASAGQGTTQEDADKAAAGNYRVLEPITYSSKDGHTKASPGDIVFLSAEDAVGLLKAKAVETADTSGLVGKPGESDPRKIQ